MTSTSVVENESDDEQELGFEDMGLDERLLFNLKKMGWTTPTALQEKAIGLILDGKDVIAKGRTGCGKTGAFAIPLIQKLLSSKKNSSEQCTRSLVLTPTKELSRQIHGEILKLGDFSGRILHCVDVSSKSPDSQKQYLLGDIPDVIVGVPSKVAAHLESGNFNISTSLEFLVIDEADLIFSFGYENDLKKILNFFPKEGCQTVLTSATVNCEDDGLRAIKDLCVKNPVILKLEETSLPDSSQLTQYQIKLEEESKFVFMYALFKLKLIRGKTILFVNSVDRCYKLKLFLEQFGIPVCVLNSELPATSRSHIVGQFNRGIYEVIVASDERFLDDINQPLNTKGKPKKIDRDREKSKRDKDKESGVSRGIDFQFVSNVINFDFPPDANSYIHRVGRTARGNNKGTALSLISRKEIELSKTIEEELKEKQGEDIFKPFKFNMDELAGFQYRACDALKSVTKIAIKEARLKEIRSEMLNSVKLKSHLTENPRDAQLLKHDKALHTVKHQPHLKNVPDYIVPASLKKATGERKQRKRFAGNHRGPSGAKRKFQHSQTDALLSLTKKKRR